MSAVLTFADATGLVAKDNPGVTIDGSGNLRAAARLDANEWKPYSGAAVGVNASAVVGSATFQSSRNLMLQVKGSDQSSSAGPNLGILDADGYPSLELFHWDHDNVAVLFDAWHDSGFKSSDGGSNAAIRKLTDKLLVQYAAGVAQGGTITWASAAEIDLATGAVGINNTPVSGSQVYVNRATTGDALSVRVNLATPGTGDYFLHLYDANGDYGGLRGDGSGTGLELRSVGLLGLYSSGGYITLGTNVNVSSGSGGDIQLNAQDDLLIDAADDIRLEAGAANAVLVYVDGGQQRVGFGPNNTVPLFPLDLVTDQTTSLIARFCNSNTSTGADVARFQIATSSPATGAFYCDFNDGTGNAGEIRSNGAGTVSYIGTSDERLKEDISDAVGLLDTLRRVRVRDFRWKRSGKRDVGVVAQELAPVWPYATTQPDELAERNSRVYAFYEIRSASPDHETDEYEWRPGRRLCRASDLAALEALRAEGRLRALTTSPLTEQDEDYTYAGVDYGRLTPLLVGAVQELCAQVDDLRARLAALEAR